MYSFSTIRKHPEKYGIKHFIKFGDYNVGRDGDLLTLPTYMQFLLDLEPEEVILETIDTDELTRMQTISVLLSKYHQRFARK